MISFIVAVAIVALFVTGGVAALFEIDRRQWKREQARLNCEWDEKCSNLKNNSAQELFTNPNHNP